MQFDETLDRCHGADYFRRWHRHKANSGGLLVHKATHHFDMVNWWLSSVPEQVYASGSRKFYTPQTAVRYGLTYRGERCLDCADADKCPFYIDLRHGDLKQLYLKNEHHDGYYRDRCVFSDDMDIEDNMQLVVNYRSGATMSYSLHAFMPWEGRIVTFNGSKGRLEHTAQETTYISSDGSTPGELVTGATRTRIIPHFQSGYEVDIWQGQGGHGGADPLMVQDIFTAAPQDKYLRAADYRAGAWSILTGIAANRSLETGRPIRILSRTGSKQSPSSSWKERT